MKLLLHACCGPCSLEPVRLLAAAGHDITLAYFNPNIHPAVEYQHRLTVLNEWAKGEAIDVIEFEYEPAAWELAINEAMKTPDSDRQDRCRACYRMRLDRVAQAAIESGFEGIGTTLTVSPYQFTDIIAEELQAASLAHGVQGVFEDYRPYYPQATQRSRELGMYRQNYCGCHFSMAEAEQERQERKEQRRREKEQRRVQQQKQGQ